MAAPKKTLVWEIFKLWPGEGTVTPKGANPGAKQVLWKERLTSLFRKDMQDPPSTAGILADREMWDRWSAVRSAFDQACYEIGDSAAEDKPARLLLAVQEFAAAVEAAFSGLNKAAPFLKDLDTRVTGFGTASIEKQAWDHNEFSQMLDVLEKDHKAPGRPADPTVQGEDPMKIAELLAALVKASPEEKAQFMKELPDALKAELAKLAAPGAPVSVDKEMMVQCPSCEKKFDGSKYMAKEAINLESLPKEVRLALEDAKTTKERMAKLEKEALTSECRALAKDIGAPVEDKSAALLLAAKTGTPVALEDVTAVLTAAAAMTKEAQKILTSERGHASPAKPDSAEAKLHNRAKEIRKADPKLSKEQALDRAMGDAPDLAEQFHMESRVAAH